MKEIKNSEDGVTYETNDLKCEEEELKSDITLLEESSSSEEDDEE